MIIIWGGKVSQWWERSPPTNVARGAIPGPGVICGLSLLLVLSLVREVFSGYSDFPSPRKPTFLNSNSIRNSRATGGLSVSRLLGATLVKQSWFYLFIIIIYLLSLFIYLFVYLLIRFLTKVTKAY